MSAGDIHDAFAKRRLSWIGAGCLVLGVALVAGCARYPYPEAAMSRAKTPTSNERAQVEALKHVSPALLKRAKAPSCDVEDASKAARSSTPAAAADPNLVEIARLQLERDCFRTAELNVRRRLDKLQSSVARR